MRFSRNAATMCGLLLSGKRCVSFVIGSKLVAQRASLFTNLHAGTSDLADSICEAWTAGQTDGILTLAKSLEISQYTISDLIESTLASTAVKGNVAGIMNSWIGSCYEMEDKDLGAELAWQLLGAYDELDEIKPDLVTLSLVYSTMMQSKIDEFHTVGKETLERAKRLAKKDGGTKWRKSVAASSRKPAQQALDIKDELNDLYGIGVLRESESDLIINKPSGMACFHKHITTSGKLKTSRRKRNKSVKKVDTKDADFSENPSVDTSLETILLNHAIPLSSLNVQARGIVHRLDRGTSGCLILAKNDERHAELVTQFFLRRVDKTYRALVKTKASSNLGDSGIITLPVYGRPALSLYEVEEHISQDIARLKVTTKTGRKHQVRIHCAKGLATPIILDEMYDDSANPGKKSEANRFCLHASTLEVPSIQVTEAPVPKWWEKVIQE
mmetsp:Transcript_15535/g.23851  ORF Transcript_15535/g.23851 Transcript_15535/m.23851 type:complete len:443 (-) Transcript_15535:795-2123(-)